MPGFLQLALASVSPAQLWGWETGAWEGRVEKSLMSNYSSMQVQVQNISK